MPIIPIVIAIGALLGLTGCPEDDAPPPKKTEKKPTPPPPQPYPDEDISRSVQKLREIEGGWYYRGNRPQP